MLNSKSQAGTKVQQSKNVEASSVRPTCTKPNVVCSASVHNFILKLILSFKPKIKKVNLKKINNWSKKEDFIDFNRKTITIQYCLEEHHISYRTGEKTSFYARCYIDLEFLIKELNLSEQNLDGYGTCIINDGILLNNYDASYYEYNTSINGFVNVLGFATVSKKGIVRFSQIVYNFKYKRLLVRDDVLYKLPFKPNLQKEFGGKRATYRNNSILSLRTIMSVYKKVDKKYWQSDEQKNTLSYPRLQLS